MRIAVTGGAGFIGSNLVFALVGAGHDVCVIDDFSTGKMENVHPAVELHRMSILDPALGEVLATFRPDAVVHLAAQTDVSRSIADPEHDRLSNVDGTAAVARAAAAGGAKRILSASSAAVYGPPESLPISETAGKHPVNPYGESKLAAEGALAEALEGTATDYASMRFANVYGPRQDWRGEGGVVAIFASAFARGERPVIYGTGTQTRDFIYVGDVVGFIVEALSHEGALCGPAPDGAAYNVSTGDETPVLQISSYLGAFSGAMRAPEFRPAREGDVARSALDPSKAAEVLGWKAQQSIENGLSFTWRWMKNTIG